MTIRLYHDSDSLEFDATVVDHDGADTRVVLDRTAFYPTSGGQPHDTGLLGGVRVVDVIDGQDRIVHVTEAPVPAGPVIGVVDRVRREDFTLQHTAQHLLSAVAEDRLGWRTASVHFGDQRSLIEFETDSASEEQLAQLEEWVNAEVAAARAVTVAHEDAVSAERLRKPTTRQGPIRVVTIEGIDRSACGGTHVTSTSHLGLIMVRGAERMRGRVRVGFLAGRRAMAHSRRVEATLEALSQQLGCAPEDAAELVAKRVDSLRELEKRIGQLERELAEYRVQALISEAPTGPGGVRWLELRGEELPVAALRQMAEAASSSPGVVFLATGAEQPTVILAAHPDAGIDAGATLKAVLVAVGGRGGGSPRIAQGSVQDSASLDSVADEIRSQSGRVDAKQ